MRITNNKDVKSFNGNRDDATDFLVKRMSLTAREISVIYQICMQTVVDGEDFFEFVMNQVIYKAIKSAKEDLKQIGDIKKDNVI